MTNMSGNMAVTSVTDFFIAKLWSGERVQQCLDPPGLESGRVLIHGPGGN